MRWLIRRVLKKGKGAVSYEEDVHYGDVLTIGRAADQAIFLPDLRAALNHARVTLLSNGSYKVESLILAGIRVNGEIIYTTVADANAVIEIGNTRLTLLPAPQDFDGGVEICSPLSSVPISTPPSKSCGAGSSVRRVLPISMTAFASATVV